jgi:uncharacterized membrane protein
VTLPAPLFNRARAAVIVLWLALGATLSAWSLAGGTTAGNAALALLTVAPLLAPLRGLLAGRRRSYRWAPLTLAPSLAFALTELVANPLARRLAGFTALLAFLCLAGIVAALRSMPRD